MPADPNAPAPAAVVNVQPPTGLVSREELKAHLDPMRADIGEVKADVKTLLRSQSGSTAVTAAFWKIAAIAASLAAGVLGSQFIH